MEQERNARDGGNIWSNRQFRPDGGRDLIIGIAAYSNRRKPVDETTTVPEIPQDAA
jgi:hypothetical protein